MCIHTMNGGGINSLTEIQARTLAPGIAGKDILAKSNTGSGKTLAFLIAGVERILKQETKPDPKTSFPIVVLTPVTDLATQITNVAKRLLAYHDMKADIVIGGTSESKDLKRLATNRIDVLVTTPGRFKSLLQQSPIIKQRLSMCQTFVIDEADKMTEPGFLGDTRAIHTIACNHGKNTMMQTFMFSATMDKDRLGSLGLLKKNAVLIDAAPVNVTQVNTKVRQICVVTDIGNHLDAVINIVKEQMALHQQKGGATELDPTKLGLSKPTLKALREWESPAMSGFRIMVFLPSNAYIDFFAAAFAKHMPNVKAFVLHGGLSQGQRSKTSEAFRMMDNCVLFTSDASARGVDYPDVSCVVQMGFDSRPEYTQRVGRTGRAGKSGTTYLVVAPEENIAVKDICELLSDLYAEAPDKPVCNKAAKPFPSSGIKYHADSKMARNAFRGWLGSLASKWKRLKMTPEMVVSMAQKQAIAMGVGEVPTSKLYEKLNIKIKH